MLILSRVHYIYKGYRRVLGNDYCIHTTRAYYVCMYTYLKKDKILIASTLVLLYSSRVE